MEWFGRELGDPSVGSPGSYWTHRHQDGVWWKHPYTSACSNNYIELEEGGSSWVYHEGRIGSIKSEEDAAFLAEKFPEAIYFFADTVPHLR
jgi:hypothetical protein